MPTADRQTVEKRVYDILNNGFLSVLLSTGHRLGLFDIVKKHGPATSQTLAEKAGYVERYVREWLNGLVAGQFMIYNPETNEYHLNPHYVAAIDIVAVDAQFVTMAAQKEESIMSRFKEGGGVSYAEFGQRFHNIMCEHSSAALLPAIIPEILPAAGPELMKRLQDGIDVLEIGCGVGRPTKLLASHFPKSRFTGIDLCPEAIEMANAGLGKENLPNLTYKVEDNAKMSYKSSFDLICVFDAIHDQANPAEALRRIHAALRPEGTLLVQDILANTSPEQNVSHPLGTYLYGISLFHCMTVSLAEGGAGLGTMWGKQLAKKMLNQAGFTDVREVGRKDDVVDILYICKK
ncbi:methylase [Gaertneriomyces semiglobifer]|nr:methylase [Gaertneriomyces semiglobifer]